MSLNTPNVLQMHCTKCKVAPTCPRNGSSPLTLQSGKQVLCRIVGGYGRTAIDESRMSNETRETARRDGPCLTVAEVPTIDEPSGKLHFEVVKVWAHPIKHARESTTVMLDRLVPRSTKAGGR